MSVGWERQVFSKLYPKLRAKLRASNVNPRVNTAVESRRGPEAKMFPIMKGRRRMPSEGAERSWRQPQEGGSELRRLAHGDPQEEGETAHP